MLKNKKSLLKNNKGSAIIEVIPIIIVIVLFLNFSIGFFGAIHTGILNSISARNYAFETFRHRSNLVYFRNVGNATVDQIDYKSIGLRVHGTKTESDTSTDWIASSRRIDAFDLSSRADATGDASEHNVKVRSLDETQRNQSVSVNPIWIKTQYGICLNSTCGG